MPEQVLTLTGQPLPQPVDFSQSGLPSMDSVHDASTFEAGGATYQILHTTEFDTYEPAHAKVAELMQQGITSPEALQGILAEAVAPVGDDFAGTARKTAKLSIGTGKIETFADVGKLIASLTADRDMVRHKPPIASGPNSARVTEEQRNVHVTGFLYAASREKDNDYHLIIGLDPSVHPEMYMTMEVSGLPPARDASFKNLKSARDAFQKFFGAHAPQMAYDYYHPPIPVVIEGSLFFDMDHAIGPHPGPPSLKSRMPTIWEVHPVTSITLGKH